MTRRFKVQWSRGRLTPEEAEVGWALIILRQFQELSPELQAELKRQLLGKGQRGGNRYTGEARRVRHLQALDLLVKVESEMEKGLNQTQAIKAVVGEKGYDAAYRKIRRLLKMRIQVMSAPERK